jgi:hypothetical protein
MIENGMASLRLQWSHHHRGQQEECRCRYLNVNNFTNTLLEEEQAVQGEVSAFAITGIKLTCMLRRFMISISKGFRLNNGRVSF